MSGGLDVLTLKEDDVTKMLAATTHIGTDNVDFQMEQYVYKRRPDGIHIINLRRTWEKLLLAARAIVAIEHPSEVFVISSRNFGQRAVLKFAAHTGATPIAGRFTPGAFTNQIQAAFREPRLLIVTEPAQDQQPITEASYVNIPVIAFTNTDSPLKFVDIAIPCNTKSAHSIGLMWWLLAREVLRFRGSIPRDGKWDVVVDLFFYRDPEEAEKEEQQATKEAVVAPIKAEQADFTNVQTEVWGNEVSTVDTPGRSSWAEEGAVVAPVAGAPAATSTAAYPADDWTTPVQEDWGATATTTAAAAPAAATAPPPASDWGGSNSGWN